MTIVLGRQQDFGQAVLAAGAPKVIVLADSELAIIDLPCQAAAECRVRHGLTVVDEDSTEYVSQDQGLAEVAVRDVQVVARTVKFDLSDLDNKDIGLNACGAALARGIRRWTDHPRSNRIWREDTSPETEGKIAPNADPCVRRACSVPSHRQANDPTPRPMEIAVGGRSDFHVETALGVPRTRSRRRLPVEERASPELVDKLIDVPWLLVSGRPRLDHSPDGDLCRAGRQLW